MDASDNFTPNSTGDPLDVAAESEADVVVVGSRGLTGFSSLLLGSVSRGVLAHADRPVLVVPRGRRSPCARPGVSQPALVNGLS
jgi:Universal stress protein family